MWISSSCSSRAAGSGGGEAGRRRTGRGWPRAGCGPRSATPALRRHDAPLDLSSGTAHKWNNRSTSHGWYGS